MHRKNFYKFWWDVELNCLKEESINSHNLWKLAGRPRSGPCFSAYHSAKLAYKKAIRDHQQKEKLMYTNDLHDALMLKNGRNFWNCWRSKFESKQPCLSCVDGIVDDQEIADSFAQYLSECCYPLSVDGNNRLFNEYLTQRQSYIGICADDDLPFDAALVDNVVRNMKKGKAAGLDGLTAESLQFSHPCLPTLLSKFFNLLIEVGKVPVNFGLSYTVPLPKSNQACAVKTLSVTDFRGISISPVISKVFENCILTRYKNFFGTSDSQFGFKKSLSCSHVIYTVRKVVDHFVAAGSTVNLCAIDVRKAFDKMSHYGLFIKLMARMIPRALLSVLEHWFSICYTCVRWGSCVSQFVGLSCGVRQGGVLSPHLFAIYVDDVIYSVDRDDACTKINFVPVSIFMYADDILLLSSSVTSLQRLVELVESELAALDLAINASKSACIRIGKRYGVDCSDIMLRNGNVVPWVNCLRYLGVFIRSSFTFKCDFDNAKKSFFRAFNSVYGRVGQSASLDVIFHLVTMKCLPILTYGLSACPVNKSEVHSLGFTLFKISAKVLGTGCGNVVNDCMKFFGLAPLSEKISMFKLRFLAKYVNTDNYICRAFSECAQKELESIVNIT